MSIRSDYYRQESGLIRIPEGFDNFHVSWTLDDVLSGFKQFYEENNRWPVGADMKICEYLPNVKTLERNFGGITNVRKQLGLSNIDYSKGKDRSKKSKFLQK